MQNFAKARAGRPIAATKRPSRFPFSPYPLHSAMFQAVSRSRSPSDLASPEPVFRIPATAYRKTSMAAETQSVTTAKRPAPNACEDDLAESEAKSKRHCDARGLMATINQANAQLNGLVDGMAQEFEDTKQELGRKEDYISRLNDHCDRQLAGFDEANEALELEKEALQKEKATVRNLMSKISSLEEEVGEQVGKNDALTDKNVELARQLEKVKAKYMKSREAKMKTQKLRSQWAGIANTFGADIKQEEDEDSDHSEADWEILK